MDYLQFAASPPLVTRATAEIAPAAAAVGEVTSFTYQVRPRIEPGDPGFDIIAVDTPARIVSVEPVARLDGADLDLTVTQLDERGFVLQIPRIDSNHNGMLIELTFQAQVFDYDTPSQPVSPTAAPPSRCRNRSPKGRGRVERQQSDPGSPHGHSGSVHPEHAPVFACVFPERGSRQRRPADRVRVGESERRGAGIHRRYDLTGRQVGGVGLGSSAVSGPSGVSWDGSGDQGRLAPGLYLLQLEVETDTGRDRAQRPVAIAY